MVNAVVTEIPLKLEPVTDDAFETSERTDAEREVVLARISALFGSVRAAPRDLRLTPPDSVGAQWHVCDGPSSCRRSPS